MRTTFDPTCAEYIAFVACGGNVLDTQVAVVRWNVGGATLDASFGTLGVFTFPLPLGAVIQDASVAVLIDGSLLVTWGTVTNPTFNMLKLTPAGSLDAAYAVGGVFTGLSGFDSTGFVVLTDTLGMAAVVYGMAASGASAAQGITPAGAASSTVLVPPTVLAIENGAPIANPGIVGNNGKVLLIGFTATGLGLVRLTTGDTIVRTTVPLNPTYPFGNISFTITAQNPSGLWVFLDGPLVDAVFTPFGSNSVTITLTIFTLGIHTLRVVSFYEDRKMGDEFVGRFEVIVCLHGSALVRMWDGSDKLLCDMRDGDTVMGADRRPARVVHLVPCWLKSPEQQQYPGCLLLSPGSLGPGVPTALTAIDPGHPICTPAAFDASGASALQPAGAAVLQASTPTSSNQLLVRTVPWNELEHILPGVNRRYDLFLGPESCGCYLANGIVVKGRAGVGFPGYSYSYDSP